MMKMMATAFSPYKIKCNVIAPSFSHQSLRAVVSTASAQEPLAAMDGSIIPAERARKEEDIADTILYLASQAGAYLNRSVLVVDGGRLGTLPSTY
jgi:NAD(P)-dependent dehydrogenase (short-subunit alcohol dehydrogenase family)